jgi:hypothetical protein
MEVEGVEETGSGDSSPPAASASPSASDEQQPSAGISEGECPLCIAGSGKPVGHPGKHRSRPLDEEEINEQQQPDGGGDGIQRCEHCDQPHSGEYGSGRFCSKTCAARFATKRYLRKFSKQPQQQQGGSDEEDEEEEAQHEMIRPQLADLCTTSSAAAFHMTLFTLAVVPSALVAKEQAKLNKGKKIKRGKRGGAAAAAAAAASDSSPTGAAGGSGADKKRGGGADGASSGTSKRRRGASQDDKIIALPPVPTLASIAREDFRNTAAMLAETAPEKPAAAAKKKSSTGSSKPKKSKAKAKPKTKATAAAAAAAPTAASAPRRSSGRKKSKTEKGLRAEANAQALEELDREMKRSGWKTNQETVTSSLASVGGGTDDDDDDEGEGEGEGGEMEVEEGASPPEKAEGGAAGDDDDGEFDL